MLELIGTFTKRRPTYEMVKAILEKFQLNKALINESKLRTDIRYPFGTAPAKTVDFTINTASFSQYSQIDLSTSVGLGVNDVFFIMDMGFYISKIPVGGTSGTQKLLTFPNGLIFSNANEASNLTTLYNGVLGVTQNSTTIMTNYPMENFFVADYAQEGVGGVPPFNASYFDLDRTQRELQPMQIFVGNNTTNLQVKLPAAVSFAGVTGTVNVVTFFTRGYLVQGVATDIMKQISEESQGALV